MTMMADRFSFGYSKGRTLVAIILPVEYTGRNTSLIKGIIYQMAYSQRGSVLVELGFGMLHLTADQ